MPRALRGLFSWEFYGNRKGDQLRLGVSVDERLPGFPSYRFLRTGDMILGVLSDPSLPLDQLPNMEVHNIDSLKNSILTKPQNIALQVLRGGEVIQIAIKMAPRPQFAVPALQPQNAAIQNNARVIENFSSIRAQHADDYWHLNFDAVVDPHSDTTASNPLE